MGIREKRRFHANGGRSATARVRRYLQHSRSELRRSRGALCTILLLAGIVALLFGIASQLPSPPTTATPPSWVKTINYSDFLQQARDGNVIEATIQPGGVEAQIRHPLQARQYGAEAAAPCSNGPSHGQTSACPQGSSGYFVYTDIPGGGDAGLLPLLLQQHVTVVVSPEGFFNALPLLLGAFRFASLLVLLAICLSFLSPNRRQNLSDRFAQFGKSRARRYMPRGSDDEQVAGECPSEPHAALTRPSGVATLLPPSDRERVSLITFADVAGIDECKLELEEMVRYLRDPDHFEKLGARVPRGALLIGPPGTGKTLLAKAVAGEAGVPFFSIGGPEFVEIFVGVGASRVRDLFSQARAAAPCVIFIDEIDAVGGRRSPTITGSHEREQTLNQLLVELDGFGPRQAIIVLAATNRVDILDPALLRPGRFDRHLVLSLPDRSGRRAILQIHTRHTPLGEDVHLDHLARLTAGLSGAELANFVNEAALGAARRELGALDHQCFEEALARVQLGPRRALVMDGAQRRIIAYHESGHALVAHHLPEADPVNSVTILPRGQSLGVTQFVVEEDRYNLSRKALMAQVAVNLGGRAAEELMLGSERITTGAENDLQDATTIVRRMVTRWGMSERIGVIFTDRAQPARSPLATRYSPAPVPPREGLPGSGETATRREGPFAWLAAGPAASTAAAYAPGPQLASEIDAAIHGILAEGYSVAKEILTAHRDQLTGLAEALLEREQLGRLQFESLLAPERFPTGNN